MAGDVQGNTTNIISNQDGADINHNGNDEKILTEDGAEKETDEIEQIKLISFAEYNALKDSEKTKYVRYNPSLQSMAYAQWLALQKQAIAGFNDIGPAIEKIQVVDQLPIEDIANQLEPIAQTFNTATNIINSLTSAPIIGQLASPVFDAVLALGKMCGYLYSLVINPINMFDAYMDAYKSLDMSNYKELFENSDETENINVKLAEKELEMSKVVIPDKEIKDLYERQKSVVTDQFNGVVKNIGDTYEAGKETLETAKTALDTMDAVMGAFSLGSATAVKKMFEASYKLAKLQYEKDYNEKANDLAEQINGFESKIPVKYIKTTDLDKIKTKQKTNDAPVKDSMFEWSSDIDYTKEEAQEEVDNAKEAALENAKVLQKKQTLDKEIATLQSQIQDLNDDIDRQNTIINNPTSTEEQKARAELKKSQDELQLSILTPQLNNKINQRTRIMEEIEESRKLPEENSGE